MKKRISIIRPGALGDTLMLVPVIMYLRDRSRINLVGRFPGLEYLGIYANQCLDYDRAGWHNLYVKNNPDVLRSIMPESDIIAAFVSDPQGVVKDNLKGAFDTIPAAEVFQPLPDEEIHVAKYIALSLKQMGIEIEPAKCIEDFTKNPLISGKDPGQDKNLVVFHPGSGGKNKNYPPEFWIRLLDMFVESGKASDIVLTLLLGPAEHEIMGIFNKYGLQQKTSLLFCPDRDEILHLFQKACIFLGHDSGMTHLAAMHGVPTIALFKDSSISRWRPLGPMVKIIKKNDDHGDLLKKVFEYIHDFNGMAEYWNDV